MLYFIFVYQQGIRRNTAGTQHQVWLVLLATAFDRQSISDLTQNLFLATMAFVLSLILLLEPIHDQVSVIENSTLQIGEVVGSKR